MVLLVIAKRCKDRPEMAIIKANVGPIYMHGMAHGYMWVNQAKIAALEGTEGMIDKGSDPVEVAFFVAFVFGFFFCFLHFMTTNPTWATVLQSTLHTYMIAYQVPPIVAFTYINAILFLNIVGGARRGPHYAGAGPVQSVTACPPLSPRRPASLGPGRCA